MRSSADTVRSLPDAFTRSDVPAVLGAFDPAIERREADGFLYADGTPYAGPQAVTAGVFQRLGAHGEGFRVHPERFVDSGETVVAEGRYTGLMEATETPVNAEFAPVWWFRDGKVVRFQQYADTRQWAAAAGV